ncbi:holin [Staphylococcus phage CF5]|uniref:Holin n=1 Tax=Staphylococcus phage CF5 TaxID=3113739 RepID=A0AAX4J6X6_9CAUD|nr:holin [Staphylococcus phage CF5]
MSKEGKKPIVVGGINIVTRAKSKTFWVSIVSAIAVFANQVTGAFGLDYSTQIEQGVNIVGSVLTLLAGLGIVVDNNTKGIKDSEIVQTDYIKPRDSKDPEQAVNWENNSEDVVGNVKELERTPTEYDPEESKEDIDEHEYDEDEEPFKDQAKPYGVDWYEKVDTTKNIQDNKEEVLITNENKSTSKVLDK